MPSIRHELTKTRTARWYQAARGAGQARAWAERVRCYAALSAVLAGHAAGPASSRPGAAGRRTQPPIELGGLLKLVAERAHFAGAEPVYRRFRHMHDGRPVARWAGPDPSVRPAAALVAEAKIAAFWPYREGVVKVADALDMSPAEWAASYLRALAAWAADDRPLAACQPAGPPECVLEDMAVLAAATAPAVAAPAESPVPAHIRAARLHELAVDIVRAVLDDASITPLGAFNTVRDEMRQLLIVPSGSLADRVALAVAELSDQIVHADPGEAGEPGPAVLTADQTERLRSMLDDLALLLSGCAARGTDTDPGEHQMATAGRKDTGL
jgi:hypothetical protein